MNSYYNAYISIFLSEHNIEFIPEYQVNIDSNRYRFDFYLP